MGLRSHEYPADQLRADALDAAAAWTDTMNPHALRLRKIQRDFEHDFRRREFRHRQWTLALCGFFQIVLLVITMHPVPAGLAAMFFQVAADEARRYRRTGCTLQTRRSIWKGSTPIDAASRRLLNGWTYPR